MPVTFVKIPLNVAAEMSVDFVNYKTADPESKYKYDVSLRGSIKWTDPEEGSLVEIPDAAVNMAADPWLDELIRVGMVKPGWSSDVQTSWGEPKLQNTKKGSKWRIFKKGERTDAGRTRHVYTFKSLDGIEPRADAPASSSASEGPSSAQTASARPTAAPPPRTHPDYWLRVRNTRRMAWSIAQQVTGVELAQALTEAGESGNQFDCLIYRGHLDAVTTLAISIASQAAADGEVVVSKKDHDELSQCLARLGQEFPE